MKQHERTKNVTIHGEEYQVGAMNPFDGSWIMMRLLPKITEGILVEATDDPFARIFRVLMRVGDFDPDTMRLIQQKALGVCRKLVDGQPIPLFEPPNRWLMPEVADNIVLVMALSVHAITHNLAPFFQGEGLRGLMESISPDSTPSTSQA